MNTDADIAPSPDLMSRGDTGLLVIDVQEKLVPWIVGSRRVVWNVRRLIDGATIFGLPVEATEQYPQGIGPTVPELAQRLGPVSSKLTFSCLGCPEIFRKWQERGLHRILVCGIETHVCVQQTVLDLLSQGWRVYVAVDATGSRRLIDHRTALYRMDAAGAVLTTTEAALFEWCREAGTPEFRLISQLVKEKPPSEPV